MACLELTYFNGDTQRSNIEFNEPVIPPSFFLGDNVNSFDQEPSDIQKIHIIEGPIKNLILDSVMSVNHPCNLEEVTFEDKEIAIDRFEMSNNKVSEIELPVILNTVFVPYSVLIKNLDEIMKWDPDIDINFIGNVTDENLPF